MAERLRAATALLEQVARDPSALDGLTEDERRRFRTAAGDVFEPDVEVRRRRSKAQRKHARAQRTERVEEVLGETGIRRLRVRPVFTTPNVVAPTEADMAGELPEGRHCYVCKAVYAEIHHFYDQLCPRCAELNYRKRTETADLRGRVALLTGGRVKIGYQAGIKLLRAGAELIVTTRFPRDSAARYALSPTSLTGATGSPSTGWTSATRPASRTSATTS